MIGNRYSLHIGSSLAGAGGVGKKVRVVLPSCAVTVCRIQISISQWTIMIICAQTIIYIIMIVVM